MADDPCECVFNHEVAMRRLLSLLRETQGHCTDTECINDGIGQNTPANNVFFMTMIWGMLAVMFFMFRPQSLRSPQPETHGKPSGSGGNGNNEPPSPDVH